MRLTQLSLNFNMQLFGLNSVARVREADNCGASGMMRAAWVTWAVALRRIPHQPSKARFPKVFAASGIEVPLVVRTDAGT